MQYPLLILICCYLNLSLAIAQSKTQDTLHISYAQFIKKAYTFQTISQVEKAVDKLSNNLLATYQYAKFRKIARVAIRRKFDFYMLRNRLANFHYQQQQYNRAALHFEKAYSMNPQDTQVQRFLYDSYLYTYRYDDANDLAEGLSVVMRNKLGYKFSKSKPIDALTFTIGLCPSNNLASHQQDNLRVGNPVSGKATYGTLTYYANIIAEQTLRRRWALLHSIGAFRFDDLDVAQVADTVLKQKSSTYQYQYNAVLSYQAKKATRLALGIGYYRVQADYVQTDFDFQQQHYQLYANRFGYNCFLGNVTLSKQFGGVQPAIAATVSNFALSMQYQTEFSLTYHPFPKSKLYAVSALAYIRNAQQSQWVISQQFGGNITPSIGYYFCASYGNHLNYVTYNGLLAYCSLDPITLILGGNIHFYFKQFDLAPSYYFQQRRGNIYQSDLNQLVDTKHFFYYTQFMMLSLKYKF